MTDPGGDKGFTVTPQPLADGSAGGRRWRARRIGLALVLATAAAILTIAWLGPRLSDRPNFDVSFFATPTPPATRSAPPSIVPFGPPRVTPLPQVTRPDGPPPSGRVAIMTDAFRVLDLGTGEITTGPAAQFNRDAVFRAPSRDGWTCICFGDSSGSGGPNLLMRIVGIGPTGLELDSTDIAALPMTPATEVMPPNLTTDVDTFNGGRRGLLALAARFGDTWQLSVASIDVDGRRLGPVVPVGDVVGPIVRPSPHPSPEPSAFGLNDLYVDGPHVRVSPDGRIAFVWVGIQRATFDGLTGTKVQGWRLALNADGSIGRVTDAPGISRLPIYCSSGGFASADRMAWMCPLFTDTASTFDGHWQLSTVDLEGRAAGVVDLQLGADAFFDAPLFDRANGQAYVWDATGLTIVRIDIHTLAVTKATFDPLAQSSSGLTPGGGSAAVDWHGGFSAVTQYGSGVITGGPDGGRLFALGFDPQTNSDSGIQPSRGIFVIDRATLALVDRWAPAADYVLVTALPDGRVAAAGAPAVQTDGRFAPWEASLTIHDAANGRILVRFGQLGSDTPAFVVGP